MEFVSSYYTNVGIKRDINQDSLILEHAETSKGEVVLAVLCDGMGGLSSGEIASATTVRTFRDWFLNNIGRITRSEDPAAEIYKDWNELVVCINNYLRNSSHTLGIRLGTTLEALLLLDGKYYICHVGDCRIYSITTDFFQITKDQTFAQQEIDAGRMTPAQAVQDARSSALLQCIGASDVVRPVFLSGDLIDDQLFLLCCDGFHHQFTASDFEAVRSRVHTWTEKSISSALEQLTQHYMACRETDNITSLLIYCHSDSSSGSFWGKLYRSLQPYRGKHTAPRHAAAQTPPEEEFSASMPRIIKDVLIVHTEETMEGVLDQDQTLQI